MDGVVLSLVAEWLWLHLSKQESQETQVGSLGWEDRLVKIMAIRSSICLENPTRLQSIESQRVGHDWGTEHTRARMEWSGGWKNLGGHSAWCPYRSSYLLCKIGQESPRTPYVGTGRRIRQTSTNIHFFVCFFLRDLCGRDSRVLQTSPRCSATFPSILTSGQGCMMGSGW